MSPTIFRPSPTLGPVEAHRLRNNVDLAGGVSDAGVIVDLSGVEELSGAGLAAVTNLVARSRRSGIPVRVLMPAAGSAAARTIDLADLGRFLAPGRRTAQLTEA